MDTVSTGVDSKFEDERWNQSGMVKAVSILLSEIINENKAELSKSKGNKYNLCENL
jgi:hypothetical protein